MAGKASQTTCRYMVVLLLAPWVSLGVLSSDLAHGQSSYDVSSPAAKIGIAIVLSYHSSTNQERGRTLVQRQDPREVEKNLTDCLANALRKSNPNVRVVPGDTFRRIAFPDLDYEQAPHTAESLVTLAANQVFQQRISPLGLRYVVILGGADEENLQGGNIRCTPLALAPPVACFGGYVWDKRSRLGAIVVDIDEARAFGERTVHASGKAERGMVGPIPLWSVTDTQSMACQELGDALARDIAERERRTPSASR